MKPSSEMEFPSGKIAYPKALNDTREKLIAAFKAEQENPSIQKKLLLVAEALMLFSSQEMHIAGLRTIALKRVVQQRADAEGRLTDGNRVNGLAKI